MTTDQGGPVKTTVKPEGLATVIIVFTTFLLILNTTVVALRIWIRAWMLRTARIWGWDDTVITLSYIAYVPCSAYSILAGIHGVGTPDVRLTSSLSARAASNLGYWEIGYAVSVNLAKASIALALMRISNDRRYTLALWAFMLSEMAISIICLITFWAICNPPGAQWDASIGSCKSYTIIPILSWPFSVVNILSDWACAVIPFLMMRKLNIKRRTKYSITAVLALGGLASIGTIARVPYLKYYYITEDRLYYFGHVIIWSLLENGLGIFASCLPSLNKLLLFLGHEYSSGGASDRADAIETIGGTPLTKLKNNARTKLGRTDASLTVTRQWNRLADNESHRDLRIHRTNGSE